jgi:hypothetical protein
VPLAFEKTFMQHNSVRCDFLERHFGRFGGGVRAASRREAGTMHQAGIGETEVPDGDPAGCSVSAYIRDGSVPFRPSAIANCTEPEPVCFCSDTENGVLWMEPMKRHPD